MQSSVYIYFFPFLLPSLGYILFSSFSFCLLTPPFPLLLQHLLSNYYVSCTGDERQISYSQIRGPHNLRQGNSKCVIPFLCSSALCIGSNQRVCVNQSSKGKDPYQLAIQYLQVACEETAGEGWRQRTKYETALG